jgi:hypothetical protein
LPVGPPADRSALCSRQNEPPVATVHMLLGDRAQLQEVPTMLATVIAEQVGWTRGMTVFKERVAEFAAGLFAAVSGGPHHP